MCSTAAAPRPATAGGTRPRRPGAGQWGPGAHAADLQKPAEWRGPWRGGGPGGGTPETGPAGARPAQPAPASRQGRRVAPSPRCGWQAPRSGLRFHSPRVVVPPLSRTGRPVDGRAFAHFPLHGMVVFTAADGRSVRSPACVSHVGSGFLASAADPTHPVPGGLRVPRGVPREAGACRTRAHAPHPDLHSGSSPLFPRSGPHAGSIGSSRPCPVGLPVEATRWQRAQTRGAFGRGASPGRALRPGRGSSDLGLAVCSRGGAAGRQVKGRTGLRLHFGGDWVTSLIC